MTLREALVTAVDFIRASGTEEPGLLTAAKALERKAEKIRARTEAPSFWKHWCECGLRRRENQFFCDACNIAIPMPLWVQFHTGKRRQSSKAMRDMKKIARTRLNESEAA